MDYRLAKEVYGEVWAIDALTANSYAALLNSIRMGSKLDIPDVQLNSMSVISNTGVKYIRELSDLDSIDSFNGVGILNFDGVITLNGGISTRGVIQQKALMLQMAQDQRVKSFLIIANSGGGSTAAVEMMSDTILKVRNEYKKDVKAWIPQGGTAASAMYGIISACSSIHAEHEMSIVGSCGTMIIFNGRKSGEADSSGNMEFRVYASKSEKKNNEIEQALNNNNIKPLQDDLLNPINERFLNLIESNRPILKDTDYDNGHTEFTGKSVGKFIDSICTFDEIIVSLTSKKEGSPQKLIKNSSKKMTVEQLKSENPEVYNSIFNAGINQERERVNSWLAWKEVDNAAALTGVESGNNITSSEREKMTVKAISSKKVEELTTDSANAIRTDEVPQTQETTTKSEDEIVAELLKSLD